MFEFTRIPVFIVDAFVRGYDELEIVTIYDGEWFCSYHPKKHLDKTSKEGIRLYSSRENFEKFKKYFYTYRDNARAYFNKISTQDSLSREEFINFFTLYYKFYHFYRRTEFFYLDSVFEHSKTHKETKEILKEFGAFKNEGRMFLNSIIFDEDRFSEKVVQILSKQFDVHPPLLFEHTYEEILDMFDGKKLKEEMIHARKKGYVISYLNNILHLLHGDEALTYIKKSEFRKKEDTVELKGRIANNGYAKGIARTLIFNFEDTSTIAKQISKMNIGDIIVAETTSPEWTPAFSKAAAIVTAQGGLMSHAAVVSRELNLPCIVDVKNILKVVKDGDLIEVDANKGIVKVLE